MDIRKVKKLIELLEESNIDEIEIIEGEESVRISRNSHAAPAAMTYAAPQMVAPAPAPAAPAALSCPAVVRRRPVDGPMPHGPCLVSRRTGRGKPAAARLRRGPTAVRCGLGA